MKQIFLTNINTFKSSNPCLGGRPVEYLQKRGGVEFGITNSASCREEYLNPGPSNYKLSFLTTRPGGRGTRVGFG